MKKLLRITNIVFFVTFKLNAQAQTFPISSSPNIWGELGGGVYITSFGTRGLQSFAGLNVQHKKLLYQLKLNSYHTVLNDPNFLLFAAKTPVESFLILTPTIGYCLKSNAVTTIFSSGIGYAKGIVRGNYIKTEKGFLSTTKIFEKHNLNNICIPLEITIKFNETKNVGFGIHLKVSVMKDFTVFDLGFALQFGKINR
jgi:hypothetical protein